MKKGLRVSNLLFLICGLPIGLYLTYSLFTSTPVKAAAGINQTINFQGRLLNAQGATVPDGHYNIEFKIYQDGDGQTVGDTTGSPAGTLKWTEDYLNNNSQAVTVVNGYLSVKLGSITAFGSNIDWNQDTLWLSMNIGGTNATCTPFASCSPDGEMIPMQPLTSAPYAFNAGRLGGLLSTQFIQLAQGLQTDASTANSIYINKTGGSGNIIELQKTGNDVLVLGNTGLLTLQPAAALTGTSNQSHITQTITNNQTGGTVNGYSQAITVSNASGTTTTNGINVAITDNASALANTNTGLKITLAGTNTSQKQYGVDASTNGGIALRGVSSGGAGTVTCGATSNYAAGSIGVCGVSTTASSVAYGGMFKSLGNGGTALYADNGGSTSQLLQLQDGGSDAFVVGVGGSVSVTPTDATKTIALGSTAQTGTITLGRSTATNTISIGAAAGASNTQTINIGTSATGSSTTNVNIGSSIAGTVTVNSALTLAAGKTLTVNSDAFTDLTGTGLTDSSNALSIDTTASLTWTGAELFNGGTSFTPNSTNDVTINGDSDSNLKLISTISSDVSVNPFDITLTDNASASTGTIYGLAVTNADNGANTGVPDALAYLNNANAAETVPNGLLIEQTDAGTLTNGVQIKRTAGTIATGLLFSGTGYTNYIDTPSSTFKVDGSGNTTTADITCASTNCISLGGETSGNYVASITNGTGIAGGNGGSETAALTLSIDQSASLTWTGTETFTPSGSNNLVFNGDDNSNVQVATTVTGNASSDGLVVTWTDNGSGGNSAAALKVVNAANGANAGVPAALAYLLNSNNTADTIPNGLLVEQNGANSTLTNGIEIRQTAGTLTTGLQFTGTFGAVLKVAGTTVLNSAGQLPTTQLSGNFVASISNGTGISGSCASNACAASLSIDQSASLTWTGTHAFNGPTSFTPNSSNDVVVNGDDDSNLQANSNISSDVSQSGLAVSLTDNASANTGNVYGLSITNNDNGANTGVPDALAYLNNANAAETTGDGLLVEQTGAGTLSNGVEIKRTAGAITTGLLFSGTGYTSYIDTPSSTFKVDGSGNTTTADITCSSTNCISLGGETSGNYVASITNGTGITGGNGGSETAALTLAIDQSASLTWTGAETFTPSGTNNIVLNGDDNSNVQIATTVTGNASSDGLSITWTDNGNAANTAAAFKVINAANGANAGAPAALAYLLNSNNTADTIADGLLVEQNGASSTLTSGIEVRQTAGTVTTGLQFTGTFGAVLKLGGTTVINSSGQVPTSQISGNFVASITNGTGISGSCASNACAASLSIDQSASLTWTGTHAFNGPTSFTPNSTNDVVVNGDNDTNLQANATITSDVSHAPLAVSLTDNASASTGSLYGLSVTNNDNGANTGVADALAYLNNANAAETTGDGLLVEQTGAGTLTNGIEIKRTAGTITTGLLFSGTGYTSYIDTPSSVFKVDGSGNTTTADITCASTNCISLGGETSGNYVTSITNGTGITGGNGGSEGAALTVAIDQSSSLTWTGTETFTPSGTNNVVLNGDDNSNIQVATTVTGNASSDGLIITWTDNGSGANSGAALKIVNAANGANGGTPAALAYLLNSNNTADTIADGLLVEQNGANSTLSSGIEIKQSAGTVTTGLQFTGTFGAILKVDGTTVINSSGQLPTTQISGNFVASIANGTGISGSCSSNACAASLSIDQSASLTWTGTHVFNGPTSFTPNSSNDVVVNGDNDTNLQANATTTSDVSQSALQVSLTDNASASTGSIYGLSVTNNDNGANTGVADALAYLNNANAAETTSDGLLVEQTGAGTLTNGVEIKRTAGAITTGLLFSGTGYTSYIDTPSSTFKVDGSGNVTAADITCASTNCIALSTETSGNYVASVTNGTGISGGNGGSEGAALTIAIDQSSSLTWTGTEAFNGATTFTPSGSNNVTFTGDDNSNVQVASTIGADVTQTGLAISLTDNANASTGSLYGLSVTNNDNSTNTGVPDAIAYLKNANSAETVSAGLLVEQTGSGTLTSGLEIKRSAGTIASGLTFTGTFTNLINATSFTVTNGGAVSASGSLTIGASAGSGTLITNNGALVNSTLALSNFDYSGSGNSGSIGSAASTVDIYASISINQTTSGQTLTIPSPTASTTYGRAMYLSNIGSQAFIIGGIRIPPGSTATLIWSHTNGGDSWQFAGAGGASIENQNAADQTADFRINGTGRANTSFISPLFDSITGGISIGTSTATGVTVGGTTNTSSIVLQGTTAATYDLGTSGGTGNITLGKSTAGQVINIGAAQVATGSTQTIHIGDSATGTGKDVITIGNTNGASSLTLSAGTAGISLAADTTVSAAKLLVVGSNNGALTCTNGGIYYDTGTTHHFKGCVNGTFVNLDNYVDVQSYTSGDNTWTKPAGASVVQVIAIGGGGGGGGGGSKNGGAERNGGGGGAGGAYATQIFQASDLGSTAHADVGTAGSSGAGASGNGVNGSNGGGGGASCFSSTASCGGTVYVKGYGGGGGAGGGGVAAGLGGGGGGGGTAAAGSNATTITGATGGLPEGMAANANASGGAGGGGGTGTGGGAGNGNAGGAAEYGGGGGGGSAAGNSTSGNGGSSLHGAGGGGAGTSINSGNSTGTGGVGGVSQSNTSGGGGAAGTSGSACNAGGDAAAGGASTTTIKAGNGGGGGGANGGGGGVGCAGGTGGAPGGGAGGGGAGTSSAGAGGAGATGKIWIITW